MYFGVCAGAYTSHIEAAGGKGRRESMRSAERAYAHVAQVALHGRMQTRRDAGEACDEKLRCWMEMEEKAECSPVACVGKQRRKECSNGSRNEDRTTDSFALCL